MNENGNWMEPDREFGQTALSVPCRVLSLDGGGAKGFYTLGVLKQIEAMLGRPLCECFDLIFGTRSPSEK